MAAWALAMLMHGIAPLVSILLAASAFNICPYLHALRRGWQMRK
jgi:hypothetical protein